MQPDLQTSASSNEDGLLDGDMPPKYLFFSLAGELYGTPLTEVKEVLKYQPTKPVPYMKKYFKGIINLRGQIISIIDIREKLNMNANEDVKNSLILILEVDGAPLGAIVDNVVAVVAVKDEDMKNNSNITSNFSREFFLGVCEYNERLVNIIRLGGTLTNEDFAIIKKRA